MKIRVSPFAFPAVIIPLLQCCLVFMPLDNNIHYIK